MKYITTVNNQTFEIEINSDGKLFVNGEHRDVDFKATEGQHGIFSLLIDNKSYEAVVEFRDGNYQVLISGDLYEVEVIDERRKRLSEMAGSGLGGGQSGELVVRSPMPGAIVAIPVHEGQEVKKGQTIIVLESMKMENELKAPRDGIVARIHVKQGDGVEQNKALITMN
jgi:biotin carboxyl carrier protein